MKSRLPAVVMVALSVVVACGQQTASSPSPRPEASDSVASPVPMPPPSTNPSYPPQNLPDLVALADRGVDRRFIGMEGQPVGPGCNRAWMRVYEPGGTAAQQMAADLLKVSIERYAFQKSCGAFIYGTTDRTVCNCYHAEHGYLQIDRGQGVEPAPGKMLVFFAETDTAAPDWAVVVDAPND